MSGWADEASEAVEIDATRCGSVCNRTRRWQVSRLRQEKNGEERVKSRRERYTAEGRERGKREGEKKRN